MWRLVVRDRATGAVVIDQSTNLPRIIGTVETGGVSGSMQVPGFATGIPWTEYVMIGTASFDSYPPTVSVNGLTLSWSYSSGGQNAIIYYGVS